MTPTTVSHPSHRWFDVETAKTLVRQAVVADPDRTNLVCQYVTDESYRSGVFTANCLIAEVVVRAGFPIEPLARFEHENQNFEYDNSAGDALTGTFGMDHFTCGALHYLNRAQKLADGLSRDLPVTHPTWSQVLEVLEADES